MAMQWLQLRLTASALHVSGPWGLGLFRRTVGGFRYILLVVGDWSGTFKLIFEFESTHHWHTVYIITVLSALSTTLYTWLSEQINIDATGWSSSKEQLLQVTCGRWQIHSGVYSSQGRALKSYVRLCKMIQYNTDIGDLSAAVQVA